MNFWGIYSFFYDNLNKLIPYQKMLEEVIDELALKEGENFLDAGCGTGNLLQKITLHNLQITGIDANKQMLNLAQKKIVHQKINFLTRDFNKTLHLTELYDKISLVNVLYILENPSSFLKEVHGYLKPGGRLVLTTPTYDSSILKIFIAHAKLSKHFFKNLMLFLNLAVVGILNLIILLLAKSGKYHFFNETELQALLQESGFQKTNIEKTYGNQAFLAVANK